MRSHLIITLLLCLTATHLCAGGSPTFTVGDREIVQTGQRVQFYGVNGASPVRATGTLQDPHHSKWKPGG